MLSVGIVTTGGVGYYLNTVGSGVDDYYARVEPGRWMGAGAERIGLGGQVHPEQVDALATGRHPVTGEALGIRPGKVAAFDLTFSSPKSVSVLAELADPEIRAAVNDAHAEAVTATLRFVEDEGVLVGRRGAGGAHQVPTRGAIAAAFTHRTSRAGDPQLHTHLLVFNRALGADGRWGGLHGRRVFAWAKTAGYLYQAALRAELTDRLGVTWQPVHHGVADIDGIADKHLEGFSTRRAQIQAALDQGGFDGPRAAQVATLATRPAKPEPVDAEVQRAAWWEHAHALGLHSDHLAATLGRAVSPSGLDRDTAAGLARTLAGPAGLTAHHSTFDRRAVLQALAEAAGAGARPAELVANVEVILADDRIAPTDAEHPLAGSTWTTVDLLATERALVDGADRRRHRDVAVCPTSAVDAAVADRPTLAVEQERMVRHLCTSGHGIDVVIGRAGTGKTFALDAARAAWAHTGTPVIGAALAARTAAGLEAGSGIPSVTVDQLLTDLARPGPNPPLPRRGVLVLDEAGLVGTRKLATLFAAAERHHTKVVLVGDPRQLPEVDAGGAFKALADRPETVELTENRRQNQPWERDALAEIRHGDVPHAVTIYRDRGRITLAPTAAAAIDQLVGDWWASRADMSAERIVMLALHQADVELLNGAARERLLAAGQLQGRHIEVDGKVFAVGDQVLTLRNDRRLGVTNGTRATITDLDLLTGTVTIEDHAGTTRVLSAGYLEAGHLTYGYGMTVHKAQGLTTERAFLLGSERLYREAGYVGLSRATTRTDLYHVAPTPPAWQPAVAPIAELTRTLSRTAAQTLASDQTVTVTGSTDRDDTLAALHQRFDHHQTVGAGPDQLRALHRGIGRRLALLRDTALAAPGDHLLERIGPPPPAGPGRDAWAAAAVAIDAYRDRYHHHGPAPLGPRPEPPEQRRHWEHAHVAALDVDRHRALTVEPDRSLGYER